MSEIPSIYWMVIIGAVTVMICLVLYYIAMLIKETKGAVEDSRRLIKDTEVILEQATKIVTDVQGMVEHFNTAIVGPINRIGSLLTLVGDFFSGIRGK